jgi:glycosyltransferase involved in cell wall biosynthesis
MARVDIILTAGGRAESLRATLESIRGQSLRDWRVIAAYDPASEGLRAELDGGDERVVAFEASGRTVSAMRNEAMARAEGRAVCFLEAGGVLAPSALSHLLAAADAGTHGAACGSWLVMHENGKPDGPPIDPPEGSIGLGSLSSLLGVPASAALVQRSLLRGKRFGANLDSWSHTDLWLRLCEDGVRWQVVPSVVVSVPHDPPLDEPEERARAVELRSVVERSFRRASARGWEEEGLDEAHERETVRSALFTLATRRALRGSEAQAKSAVELFAGVGSERCLTPDELAMSAAISLRYSPAFAARVDGRAEHSWARAVHEWWSRCVSQKWVARHEVESAVPRLAELLVDPREVARDLLGSFGKPGRLWVGGTDRAARAVIEEALEAGWRVLVLPGRASQGVNTRLMALPSRVMVASASENIGTSDPLVIGSADEGDLLERYGARPNVARWNGAWRTASERAVRRLESAWPRRDD